MRYSVKSIWKSMRQFRFKSVFFQLFIITFCVSLVPLIAISVFNYYQSNRYVQERIEQENQNYAFEMLRETRHQLDDLLVNARFIATNQETLQYSIYPKTDYSFQDIAKSTKYIFNMMQMLSTGKNAVDSVYLYVETDNYVAGTQASGLLANFPDSGWKNDYDHYKNTAWQWAGPRMAKVYNRQYYFYTFGTIVRTDPTNILGAILINLDMREWSSQMLPEWQPGTRQIFITDDQGNVIATNRQDYLFKPIDAIQPILSDHQTYYVTHETLDHYNWQAWILSPRENYLAETAVIGQGLLLILLGGTASLLLVGWIVSTREYRPVAEILELFNNKDFWLENSAASQSEGNEYKRLKANILKTIYYNTYIKDELNRREQTLDKMQSIALQLQISPHFLFNTLETINLLALDKFGDENIISQMVVNLSQLLRVSLNTNERLLPLKAEYENLRSYLEIQKHRLNQQLRVVYELPDELSDVPILKMLLQPLVENAVSHGIKPSGARQAVIRISSSAIEGNLLQIDVSDDGIGLPQNRIDEINQMLLQQEEMPAEEHIGLANIQNRIRLVYGEQYGVSIFQNVSGGITSRIRIPMQSQNSAP